MAEQMNTPWAGELSADLRRGPLSVSADGVTIIDSKRVCWAIVFPKADGTYSHVSTIVDAVNSYAPDKAKIAALVKALADLLEHAETQGDFKNGVSHNGIDEGEVYASGLFDAARAALSSHTEQEGGGVTDTRNDDQTGGPRS